VWWLCGAWLRVAWCTVGEGIEINSNIIMTNACNKLDKKQSL
jgi:hypothetical protein